MTLNVSVRVGDGIVLASDSLATQMQAINPQTVMVQTTCPSCTKPVQQSVAMPPIPVPVSTWPHTQKMYPIQKKFGLATWGQGVVNGRSIYNHITGLDGKFPGQTQEVNYFDVLTDFIRDYFVSQLKADFKLRGIAEASVHPAYCPFGFQFVGFSTDAEGNPIPKTNQINIALSPVVAPFEALGCTITGETSTIQQFVWKGNTNIASYGSFSLQDAVDYAKFLIRTTADFQRFLGRFQTVGGEIDVGIITNRNGFKWVAQKSLYRTIESEEFAV